MTKGAVLPSESRSFADARTGARIRQITRHASIHHHPFFLVPAYDDAMRHLAFVSHRTGGPQIFLEIRESGQLLQLTDRPDIHEWSIYPSHDGRYVYFTAGTGGWRVHTETLKEDQVLDFTGSRAKEQGYVAEAMGTTALSFDDGYWAVRSGRDGQSRLHVLNTQSLASLVILERDVISHMMFCPDDNTRLLYGGPLDDRLWCIRRDGTENKRLYQREDRDQWLTHESWIPGTGEVHFVDWHRGTRAVNPDTLKVRAVTGVNAWHAISNRQGTLMAVDTNFPDRGIVLFDPRQSNGPARTLCHPESSNAGAHWEGPFPYNNGPIKVYAPQHTHPHPSFSPDGKFIVYSSDKSGHAQIFEVEAGR